MLPTWHPLRLAEDYAVADIVTGGRVIFGIGRGYQTREVETLGAPLLDQDANRELFEEQLELIRKAFDEESFSHHGKHYRIPAPVEFRGYPLEEVTLVPRPIHRPVEIWQAVSSGRSVARMAQLGIKGMVTLTGERMLDEWVHLYQDEAAKAGRELELGEDLCWGVGVYLADSEEEAIRRMEPYHDERYKWFEPFGIVRYVDEQGRQWGSPGAPSGVPVASRRRGPEGLALRVPLRRSSSRSARSRQRYPGLDQMMIHLPEGMPPARVHGPAPPVRARRHAGVRSGAQLPPATCNDSRPRFRPGGRAMELDEYAAHDAVGLAALIRAGDVSADGGRGRGAARDRRGRADAPRHGRRSARASARGELRRAVRRRAVRAQGGRRPTCRDRSPSSVAAGRATAITGAADTHLGQRFRAAGPAGASPARARPSSLSTRRPSRSHTGRRTIPGISSAASAARAAARRRSSPRARCRSRTGPTAAARSGSRPRSAVSSG